MIKFRAWDKATSSYRKVLEIEFYPDGELKKVKVAGLQRKGTITPDNLVLEQFTGLTDTSGDDIYEGDLVRLTDDLEDPIYKVIFDEAKFEIIGGGVCYDLGEEFMDCEVIGNVHANPELLEVEK